MTDSEIHVLLNTMGQWLTRGETTQLARLFACPLPVYVGDKFVLLRNTAHVRSGLMHNLAHLKCKGVQRITGSVQQIEDSTNNRCLVLVNWDMQRADGTTYLLNTQRYVMRRSQVSGQPEIELVEAVDAKIPQLCDLSDPESTSSAQIL